MAAVKVILKTWSNCDRIFNSCFGDLEEVDRKYAFE